MIRTNEITKHYGSQLVLSRLSLCFGSHGLVAILGRSGCGKTTLLNILGGLDHKYDGSLQIDSVPSTSFDEKDWDAYRSRHVGFVFQDAHLVDYLNVADNVKLALEMAGPDVLGPNDASKRVHQVLDNVGLLGLETRMPSELSGGQAQRVAVARALVKDPQVVLADEPTGALDIQSSQQVMKLLVQASRSRLVIVVTHNRELAHEYADRIIELGEHRVLRDTNASKDTEAPGASEATQQDGMLSKTNKKGNVKGKRTPRRPRPRKQIIRKTALSHMRNKRQRAVITTVVAALGIMGMCLAISVQDGARAYTKQVAATTLATSPIVIQQNGTSAAVSKAAIDDLDGMGTAPAGTDVPGEVTTSHIAEDIAFAALQGNRTSDLQEFLWYVDSSNSNIWNDAYDVQVGYAEPLNVYDSDGTCIVSDGSATLLQNLSLSNTLGSDSKSSLAEVLPDPTTLIRELPYNEHTGASPYELLAGRMPTEYDEAVIITDYQGRVSDYFLYATGIADLQALKDASADLLLNKQDATTPGISDSYSFDDLLGREFSVMPASDYYTRNGNGWSKLTKGSDQMNQALENAPKLKIVGIVRESSEIKDVAETGAIGYSSKLVPWLVDHCNQSEPATEQKASPDVDVFTGKKFSDESRGSKQAAEAAQTRESLHDAIDESELSDAKREYLDSLSDEQVVALREHFKDYFDASGNLSISPDDMSKVAALSDDDFKSDIESIAPPTLNTAYAQNMQNLGAVDKNKPSSVRIYPAGIDERTRIVGEIDSFNSNVVGDDSAPLSYEDMSQRCVEQVTKVVGVVNHALIALMVLALALSVFMLFSVTSVAAIERRAEIGTFRALGASRRDVVMLFNWENAVIGLVAGCVGALAALVVSIPLSNAIADLTGEAHLVSPTPWTIIPALVVGIALAVLSGLVPAVRAAKVDPVQALR